MRKLILGLLPVLDVLLVPFVYPAALLLKIVRRAGTERLPVCRKALVRIGVFPIRDHYYEPQFDFRNTEIPSGERYLPGVDWNISEQLEILDRFRPLTRELEGIPREKPPTLDFYLDNEAFLSGDAEYWYQLIRSLKPARIYEVGSGKSTLMAIRAIRKNQEENSDYRCEHVCIEPYEARWLENTDVRVVRRRVEDLGVEFFVELGEGDVLFIDSSHVIKPRGDVLFEYLELLPSLRAGVVVHLHDIFSPRNYPKDWIEERVQLWNEQYLLEAFLSENPGWKIIGALNYLHHNHYERLKAVAPYLRPDREPGSFYIRKIRTGNG